MCVHVHAHPLTYIHACTQSIGLAKVCDGECQTPVHFVEKHIDPKYDWNEWSLRRKAIQVLCVCVCVCVPPRMNC
jgi:hypothetical protein